MPLIIKKDGRRETFEREKLLGGIRKACQKREISLQKIDDSVQRIEKRLHACGLKEVPSKVLGEMVMSELHQLDKVAYVRFASVYREFRDVEEFVADLQGPEPQALDAPTGHPSFPFLQKSEVPADSQPTS
jgi:transcriptional repressor NrdR